MKPIKTKISIIGSGMVGSTVASSLLQMDMAAEIALIDVNRDKALGEAIDLFHTTSFSFVPNSGMHIGTYDDCKDSQIIVITAGPSLVPGKDYNRNVLAEKNVKVARAILSEITKRTKDAILIFVTNPVDILTYIAQNEFGYPKEKVIGAGTVVDTARFRRYIASKYNIDTQDVSGFVLGEHGSTCFATWSLATVGGVSFDKADDVFEAYNEMREEEIIGEVRSIGFKMVDLKGFTNHGIAAATRRIIQAILLNEMSILPIATTFTGEYGIDGVAMSIPAVIGSTGIQKTLEFPLSEDEVEAYRKSAEYIKSVMSACGVY